jgi:hypothetical protein
MAGETLATMAHLLPSPTFRFIMFEKRFATPASIRQSEWRDRAGTIVSFCATELGVGSGLPGGLLLPWQDAGGAA